MMKNAHSRGRQKKAPALARCDVKRSDSDSDSDSDLDSESESDSDDEESVI